MDRRAARKWIRDHFTTYILNADMGMDNVPPEVEAVWHDETQRIADRISPRGAARAALAQCPDNPAGDVG